MIGFVAHDSAVGPLDERFLTDCLKQRSIQDRWLLPRQDLIVVFGVRSLAMMRACLVAGRAADFDDAGVGRLRDLDLLDVGEAERVVALAVDLGLVMGSSEVHATPSA